MNKIIYLVGLPCSGKSTYQKEKYPNAVVVSNDLIVEEIAAKEGKTYNEIWGTVPFSHIKEKTREIFDKACEKNAPIIIIDNTNMSAKTRRTFRHPDYETECIIFNTDLSECLKRNEQRSKTGKTIPRKAYDDMLEKYQTPSKDEGFSKITYVE